MYKFILLSFFLCMNIWGKTHLNYSCKNKEYIYGVTITSFDHLTEILKALKHFPKKLTVRIYVKKDIPIEQYRSAIKAIHKRAYIMLELVDSADMKDLSVEQYLMRMKKFMHAFKPYIKIWEIGNEVNGNWSINNPSDTNTVKDKIIAAYNFAQRKGLKTALTLFYNIGCSYSSADYQMFNWANKNIPDEMKKGLAYVFLSYYPDECKMPTPVWDEVFAKLHIIFPNAKLGFGELGTEDNSKKAALIKNFYQIKIDKPYFVGGYFWWYFNSDMVPMTKPLYTDLRNAIFHNSSIGMTCDDHF